MTLPYDFWIGAVGSGLGFNKFITKDQPYERATAQFRKEQFDSSQTVGDQSLAGWWTRGQLSFHKGAGIKYYEVLDGDPIFNRFRDSSGVDPWKPGQLTLAPSSTSVALSNIADAVGATWSGTPGVVALKSDGKLYSAAASATEITNTKTLASYGFGAITTSGSAVYPCKGDGIYALNGVGITYTNFVKNPKFYAAGDTTQITKYDSANPGQMSALSYNNGTLTWTTANAVDDHGFTVSLTGLTNGTTYTVHLKQSGSRRFKVGTTAGGFDVINGLSTASMSGTFTAMETTQTLWVVGLDAASYTLTELAVTTDSYSTSWNPRDNALYSWSGTADASISTRTVAANSWFDILWHPATGRTWAGAWWAKGRFFALDDLGQWYTLSTAGGTAVEASDVFWTPGLGTTGWSVAESPAAVYISHGTDIYAILPDASGLIPTITTPVVAASFPTGETIASIYAYLGRVIACTSLGLRVAVVQADGLLAYGPHAVEGNFSGTVRMAALRELAYVVGTAAGDTMPSLFNVNMVDDIADLQPVWANLAPLNAGTLFGATITPDGLAMAWDGAGFYRTGSGLQTTGYVSTGFHRLGTLDAKSFQYLRVKTEGTVGSVAVKVLLPDGTETSVGTVSAGNSADMVLTTAAPNPVEYLGLKFTLTGNGTTGPTLLGYQLKALPVPKRQRMIRVPLMLFDREADGRSGTIRGQKGSAWTRLAALEALEESNAVVKFTDSETGETGSAYIEAVEVRRLSPVSRQDDGFGGLLYLTLRRL